MGSAMEMLNSRHTHRVKQAEIDAKRVTQAAYNEREAATTSLARFAQSVGNQRKMDAMGKALAAQASNISNALDAATVGTFSQRLAAASELGAASVNAAAAGVGGSSVDAYRQTLSLNYAIQEQAQQDAIRADVVNATDALGDTVRNSIASLDGDSFSGNFDYTQYLDHVKQKNVVGAAIAIGVATYFGGPQAGMAASDAIASGNRAANGDQAGSNALINSAISNGYGAYQSYRAQTQPQGRGAQNVSPRSGFWSSTPKTDYGGSFTIK